MKRQISADIVIALLLLTMCGALFADTFFYKLVPGAIIGSKIWPRIVITFLGSLSAIYLVKSLRTTSEPSTTPWRASEWLKDNRNVIGCFAFYGVFLLTMDLLGMLLGGILFVFATLSFLGHNDARSHVVNALVAIVTIGSMWALFRFGLGVILPEGEILPR